MAKSITDALLGNSKSDLLDWAVFGIGALALTVAIAGTILTHSSDFAANEAKQTSTIAAG